jgi:trk system potassium uptake protein TrkH
MKHFRWFVFFSLTGGIAALLLEHVEPLPPAWRGASLYVYIAVLGLFLVENLGEYRQITYKRLFFKRNVMQLFLVGLFIFLLALRLVFPFGIGQYATEILPIVIIFRGFYIIFDVREKLKRLNLFVVELFSHPARTILISFLLVILAGSALLQMPLATADGEGLRFIDSLFTSTSAVCVTGLIVVDTATAFTPFGQMVILGLIQIGGLSIIILSFFVLFILRQSVSLEGKLLISYVLSEKDMTALSGSLKKIVIITLAFEGLGAVLLFIGFLPRLSGPGEAAYYAVFHAISAFCNAGFALFTTSFEGFVSSPLINLTICFLIIFGGLSFVVFVNLSDRSRDFVERRIFGKNIFVRKLTLNSRVVLAVSGTLIVAGMLVFYALEHGNVLRSYRTGTQYLSAFFQSVTLRTAGFNTVPFSNLRVGTYLVMMLFMFIGGASGSTAGGIKVNTLTIVTGYIKSILRNQRKIVLFRHSISKDYVLRAILIILFGLTAVFTGSFILSLTEDFDFIRILFETVSAFGTVGLSAGITGGLSYIGKIVIILLMYVGRTGPLTILAAMSEKEQKIQYEYPYGDILIG